MGAFFDLLRSEHEEIRKLLAGLAQCRKSLEDGAPVPAGELERLHSSLKRLVADIHHAKEEAILFPALLRSGVLDHESGPRCSEFMQIKMEWDPARSLLERAPDLPTKLAVPCQHMLSIPLEEHAAGHLALQLLPRAISEAQQSETGRKALSSLIRDYCLLMDVHIRKENECLFVIADSALGDDVQRILLESAAEHDRHYRPGGIS